MTTHEQALLQLAGAAVRECRSDVSARDLAEGAELLVATIAARDLADAPLYVVGASTIRAGLLAPATSGYAVLGYTSARMSWSLRGHLGDRWRGPGPACIIADDVMREHYGAAFPAAFVGTALHELAHVLPVLPAILASEPMGAAEGDLFREWGAFVAREAATRFFDVDHAEHVRQRRQEFEQHAAPTFLRIALHLQHRAALAGVYVPVNHVFDQEGYAHSSNYSFLLSGELDRMAGATVAEILAEPLPAGYLRAWLADAEAFARQLDTAADAA